MKISKKTYRVILDKKEICLVSIYTSDYFPREKQKVLARKPDRVSRFK